MADQIKIYLSKEQFESGELPFPNNSIVVKMTTNNDNLTTKAGIIIGIETRNVYAHGSNSLAADMEECFGEVVKVPERLYYNPNDNNSMDWDTDMELKVGDIVWGGIMEFHSAMTLDVDGDIYKIIPYSDLTVAKRHHPLMNWDEVIVINGYCLLKSVSHKKISDLDVVSQDKVDSTKGIVAFVGKPNKAYKQPSYVDHPDLKVGDEVLLAPRTPILWLERKVQFAKFDGDNLYFCVPMRKIVAVLSRG